MKYYASTLTEAAEALGTTRRTLTEWGRDGCPCRPADRDGKGRYDLRKIRKWQKDYKPRARIRETLKADADAEKAAGSMKQRELVAKVRISEEKAKLAQLDRRRREGELIPRAVWEDTLARLAAILRDAGRGLQRRYGREAQEFIDEALQRFEREVDDAVDGVA